MSWSTGEITPTALKRARKHVRDSARAYAEARRTALALKSQGAHIIDREDAVAVALNARHFLARNRAYLVRCESLTVVKGAHVCPATRERLVARGIWKQDHTIETDQVKP